jgi:hypothetical protein
MKVLTLQALSQNEAERAAALVCCPVEAHPEAPLPGCTQEPCGFCMRPVWVGPSAPKLPIRMCAYCHEDGRLIRH